MTRLQSINGRRAPLSRQAPFACPPRAEDLISLSNEELARIDPLVMNLLVAKGVPRLADLNIGKYQRLADLWAADIRRRLPGLEETEFRKTPHEWKNDIRFFRIGVVCWYLDCVLGIAYREDQRNVKRHGLGHAREHMEPARIAVCGNGR